MKTIIVVHGKEYKLSTALMDEFGLNISAWETLQKRGMLPQPVKLGRFRYYDQHDFEDRLLQGY